MSKNGDVIQRVNSEPPELRSTYHDSFGGSGGRMGPSYKVLKSPRGQGEISVGMTSNLPALPAMNPQPSGANPHDTTRLNLLEGRLANQEKNAQSLLERALKIKEDVIQNLNITHNSWQGEIRQRQLLQDHIRAITDLIKQMDWDIKNLGQQMQSRDTGFVSASAALKNLEVQHATSLTDLRGRIARCDSSIAKLATDQHDCGNSLKQLTHQNHDSYQRLVEKLQAMELRISESSQKMDRASSENMMRVQQMDGGASQSLNLLDSKLSSTLEEVKRQIQSNSERELRERERLSVKMEQQIAQAEAASKDKLEKLQLMVSTSMSTNGKEAQNKQDTLSREIQTIREKQKGFEERIMAQVSSALQEQEVALQRLKKECREGFSTIHESITSSKNVLEGKLSLSEEKLRKEIQLIRKMVILV